MRYYVDFEFTRFEGEIISMAMVSDPGHQLYLSLSNEVLEEERKQRLIDPWVVKNVLPIIDVPGAKAERYNRRRDIAEVWPQRIFKFIQRTNNFNITNTQFITDWWEDVRLLSGLMITGPGTSINIPNATFTVVRADAYPTELQDAVQHNALWDAMALRHKIHKLEQV